MANDLRPYPEYKDSRLPWLRQIPAHWQEKRAKYFFREVDERSQSGEEELLSVSHMTGVTPRSQKNITMFMAESYFGHKLCRPGDLVINTMWAWMAALGVAKETGIVSPAYAVYRPTVSGTLDPEFVDYLLRTWPYASEYLCRSTGIRASRLRLYPEKFLEIPLVCPPQEEQEQILAYLRAKDRMIRRFIQKKRRVIELLKEQKQGIVNRAVTRGLRTAVRLKHSGVDWLGDIPAHWQVVRVKHLVSQVTSGSRGWARYAADEGPWFIRVGNLPRHSLELDFSNILHLQLPSTSEANRTRVQHGDVLVSITAYIGSVAVVAEEIPEAYVSQHVALCRPLPTVHNSRWVAYVMLSVVGQTHGRIRMYGGTKDGLSLDDVKDYPILLPPPQEQDKLVSWIDENTQAISHAASIVRREIELLLEYRARLIADVVTGKVDVRHLAPEAVETATEDLELLDEAEELFEDELQDAADLEPVEEVADADD